MLNLFFKSSIILKVYFRVMNQIIMGDFKESTAIN